MTPKAFVLLGCLALPLLAAFPAVWAAVPALPDLSVAPGDIHFRIFGEELTYGTLEFPYLTINVTVRNAGPGTSTGANVSFFDNGEFLALVPADGNLSASGPGNETSVEFNWYLPFEEAGNHTIRVEVSDPAGDGDLSDNAAEVNLTIYGRRPVIAVKFDTAFQHASVTPTSPGIVTFTGGIVVDSPDGPANVTLQADVDLGWPCSLDVTSLYVADALEHPFSVTVTVPAATRNSGYGSLRVEALAVSDWAGATAQSKALIAVDPYFCLTASAARALVTSGPRDISIFEITLQNNGNSVDSYSIEVQGRDDLERKGWSFTLSPTQASKVNPGSTRLLVLQARPPEDWAPYKDETTKITVKMTSLNSRDFGPEAAVAVPLTIEQKGFYMPSACLTTIVVLLVLLVSAAAVYLLRRQKKRKTVADYNRELHLD